MKHEWKIRNMLDIKKYHLHTNSDGEWSLFRFYDDFNEYMSPDNKPIMTSKTHTEKELLKFAKKHRIIDFQRTNFVIRLTVCYINLFICLLSIALNNDFLRGFNWCLNILIIAWALIDLYISEHNFKATMKELEERHKKIKEKLKKKLEEKQGENERNRKNI